MFGEVLYRQLHHTLSIIQMIYASSFHSPDVKSISGDSEDLTAVALHADIKVGVVVYGISIKTSPLTHESRSHRTHWQFSHSLSLFQLNSTSASKKAFGRKEVQVGSNTWLLSNALYSTEG